MRSFLVSLLLFATMLPTISPWGTIAYFHLNRAYLAKVFCENRQNPQILCYGKCYLNKKLKEEEDKDKEAVERIQHLPLLQLFTQAVPLFSFLDTYHRTRSSPNDRYRLAIYTSPHSRLLRPPWS